MTWLFVRVRDLAGLNTGGGHFFFGGSIGPMQASAGHPQRMGKTAPVSRELARIIRDASRLGREDAPLGEHVRSIEERQAQAIEFYLRSCSLRLGAQEKTRREPP